MAANAILQLFENTQWGELDYLIADFPPGTGDIQLTVMQKLKLDGVVMVTTPQEVALNDARKAASMFGNKELNVPIFGVVENMSWFTQNLTPKKNIIFSARWRRNACKELKTSLLAQIPLVIEVGEAAEQGLTIYDTSDMSVIKEFEKISDVIVLKTSDV